MCHGQKKEWAFFLKTVNMQILLCIYLKYRSANKSIFKFLKMLETLADDVKLGLTPQLYDTINIILFINEYIFWAEHILAHIQIYKKKLSAHNLPLTNRITVMEGVKDMFVELSITLPLKNYEL